MRPPRLVALTALEQQVAVLEGIRRQPTMRHALTVPTPWLRGRVAVVTKRDGSWRTCKHYRADEVGWLLLWSPGRVVCSHCSLRLHEAIRGTREDARCDVCGHFAAPSTYPFACPGGPGLVIVGGVCSACRPVVLNGWGEGKRGGDSTTTTKPSGQHPRGPAA